MSRVVVTGGRGFIGARIFAPLLEAGHEVHAISHSQPPSDSSGVIWHTADLTNASGADAVIREIAADGLVHMAWYVEPGKFWQAPENVIWVEATLGLLRCFIAAGGRRAVLAGTCAEYEWSLDRYDERTAPLAPATLYGVAKHATRMVAEALADEAEVELAWGRIFMPYGPGEARARLVPSVTRALLAGEEVEVSDGTQVRDFMYVDDVAHAFASIFDSSVSGAINVASGHGYPVRELIGLIAETVGRPELVRWGAQPQRTGEPPQLVAEVARLKQEVGFRPRFDLTAGVQRTIAWWRAQA